MTALTCSSQLTDLAASIPGSRKMFLLQNMKVMNAMDPNAHSWTSQLCRALEVEHQLKFTTQFTTQEDGQPQKFAQFITNLSKEAYAEALEQFHRTFSDSEYFFENLMVALALYLGFPNLNSREKLWKSYVSLCSLYSFFRFISVLSCKQDASKERLFHFLVFASRATLHNQNRFAGFQQELFQHDSSSLAHMAILLRWD